MYTNYNVLVGRICDAWDNHTVTPYGAADDEDDPTTLKLLTSISSITPVFYIHPSPESVYHHSLVSVDTVWPVLLSNLTGARPKLLIKYNSGMSNTRCTAISNGRFEYDSIFEYDCKDTSGVALSTYDSSVRAILEGPSNFFYHLSSTVEVEADSVTDNDELDDGATPIITYHYRVLGFNYLSRNKLLMFINHDWTSLPAVAELVVYDTGGVQYNATNVTRRSPNSYYINFDTENQLPVDFTNRVIYYVGPVDPVRDEVVGPAGPTTATRMDKFTRMMLEQTGLISMVGKSERGPVAIDAIRDNKAAYLMAVGGAAYLVSKAIKSSRVLAFADLGMEAIYEFDVVDMPVTVAVDSSGESVHQTGPKVWQARIGNIPVAVV